MTRADAALRFLADRFEALQWSCKRCRDAMGVVGACDGRHYFYRSAKLATCALDNTPVRETSCPDCHGLGYVPRRDLEALLVAASAEQSDYRTLLYVLDALEDALERGDNPTDAAILALATALGWQDEEYVHFTNPQDAIAWLKEDEDHA